MERRLLLWILYSATFRDAQSCCCLQTPYVCAIIEIYMTVMVVMAVVVGNVLSGCCDGVCSAKVGTCQSVPTTGTGTGN
jgi:hypothetical protein